MPLLLILAVSAERRRYRHGAPTGGFATDSNYFRALLQPIKEEVAKRTAAEMGLTLADIDDVLDALCSGAEFRQLEPAWIPRLSDPDDEPLLQMAVEAKVPFIVTRNVRHLKPAESCGIRVLTPPQFLAVLRTNI